MRIFVFSTALAAGVALAGMAGASIPRAGSAAVPAPPIFYCPKAMAAPPACPSARPAHAHARPMHAAARQSGHRRRQEDHRVSASQAWVYGYELGRGGLPMRHDFQSEREEHSDRRSQPMGNDEWRREAGQGWSTHRGSGMGAHPSAASEGRQGREWAETEDRFASHDNAGQSFGHARHEEDRFGEFGRRESRGESFGRSWSEMTQRDDVADGRGDGGHHWRQGEGGGYEVYHVAGRDEDGYLVWAGKPRR